MPDARSYTLEKPSDTRGTGREARARLSKLITRRAQLDELNIQTQPIYGPRGASMKLREVRRRAVEGAKLGMTVQPPKKTPYDKLGQRMETGAREQERLERHGDGFVGSAARRTQRRIPKVTPAPEPRPARKGA